MFKFTGSYFLIAVAAASSGLAHAETAFDESYFPMQIGNFWKYTYSTGVSQGTTETHITGSKTVQGYGAAMFQDTYSTGSATVRYMALLKNPLDGIALLGAEFGPSGYEEQSPGRLMPFGLAVGDKYSGQTDVTEYTAGGTVTGPDGRLVESYSYLRQPDVEIATPAGDFFCVVLEVTSMSVRADGQPFSSRPSIQEEYYAPGVGLVKIHATSSSWDLLLSNALINGQVFPVVVGPSPAHP